MEMDSVFAESNEDLWQTDGSADNILSQKRYLNDPSKRIGVTFYLNTLS